MNSGCIVTNMTNEEKAEHYRAMIKFWKSVNKTAVNWRGYATKNVARYELGLRNCEVS